MKTHLKVENPTDIEMTLTVTMRLGEWLDLAKELPVKWPGIPLINAIRDMAEKAMARFAPGETKP